MRNARPHVVQGEVQDASENVCWLQRNNLFEQRLYQIPSLLEALLITCLSGGSWSAELASVISTICVVAAYRTFQCAYLLPHGIESSSPIEVLMVFLPQESQQHLQLQTTLEMQLGKAIFWDDSFVHSVRNDHPSESRVVFTGHLFKPAITIGNVEMHNRRWELDETYKHKKNLEDSTEYGVQHEYGKLEDERVGMIKNPDPRVPDKDVFTDKSGCKMRDGIAEFRAAASLTLSNTRNSSSFLDILVNFAENNLQSRHVPMVVSGEADWMTAWANNAEGPDARPFTARNIVPWWQLEGDTFADTADDDDGLNADMSPSHMKEFSCAEIMRVFGDLQANYQKFSEDWIPGSEEELAHKFTDDGFPLRKLTNEYRHVQ